VTDLVDWRGGGDFPCLFERRRIKPYRTLALEDQEGQAKDVILQADLRHPLALGLRVRGAGRLLGLGARGARCGAEQNA